MTINNDFICVTFLYNALSFFEGAFFYILDINLANFWAKVNEFKGG